MDMNIVENHELRQLMLQGSKYREHTRVNQGEIIDEALRQFVTSCHATLGIAPSAFTTWCNNVKQAVSLQCPPPQTELSTLERPLVRQALRILHKRFVVCVTDKADKNFSIVCRHYYKHTLAQELQASDGVYRPTNPNRSTRTTGKNSRDSMSPLKSTAPFAVRSKTSSINYHSCTGCPNSISPPQKHAS